MSCKVDNKNFLIRLMYFALLVIFAAGCAQTSGKVPVKQNMTEEVTDTGVLVVESSPSGAHVYVDGELKGESPLTLYNFPVGKHEVIIRKDGYMDSKKTADLQVGMTEKVNVVLPDIEKEPVKETNEENKSAAKLPENATAAASELKIVNVTSGFIRYYDFKNAVFSESPTASPDVFSSNYGTYLYFTAYSPAKMSIVKKQIKDVKKEDCVNAQDTIVNLYPGQILCVKTTKGLYAAIGGSWTTAPGNLEWELFD